MRYLLLLSLCVLALVGCGGSGSNGSNPTPSLAGTYTGTWVNVDDAEDLGVSSWTIDAQGRITGSDIDVSQEFSYTVFGTIDEGGIVDATTSRIEQEEVIALTGRLQRDSQGRLTGDLQWASEVPSTYRYTFTRDAD